MTDNDLDRISAKILIVVVIIYTMISLYPKFKEGLGLLLN